MSFLDREIRSQPEVLAALLDREQRRIEGIADWVARLGCTTVLIVARGSSDNAGLYGKYLLGIRNRRVVALAAPSLFTLYRRPPVLAGCLVLALSQSGASDDLIRVVAEARRQKAPTLVLTNTPGSALARAADRVVPLHAGAERSVAATKSYTGELLALAMLSVALDGGRAERRALRSVPEAVSRAIASAADLEPAAQRFRFAERLAVIGRGFNYATAFELALKLKELAYLTAEPASSADFRHGPIAVVGEGFPVLLVAPSGKTLPDMRALARALRKRGAELAVISDAREMLGLAGTPLRLPVRLPEWLSPIAAVVPGQLFARHLARARGCPLDRPRGLRKITRTR